MKNYADYFMQENEFPQGLDVVLRNIGFSHTRPGYTNGLIRRDCYILHYISGGCGSYTVGGHTYRLGACDGFLVPPDTEVLYQADLQNPWAVYWIGFYGRNASLFLERARLSARHPIYRYDADNALLSAMENLCFLARGPERSPEFLLSGFYQVMGLLARHPASRRQVPDTSEHFAACVRFISENIRHPIQVQDLAAD
ncbi:MAG: AraC family ligand binding domain-containing protein [Eubacteriales bacterium]|nr:AraC family ligand binding domain-containing protein [Eubacteriales bacterium]